MWRSEDLGKGQGGWSGGPVASSEPVAIYLRVRKCFSVLTTGITVV